MKKENSEKKEERTIRFQLPPEEIYEESLSPSLALSSSITLRSLSMSNEVDLDLINAIYLRKLEAVKEAIENGADVNTEKARQTPLMIATDLGDIKIVEYLLSLPKVKLDVQNHFGHTPLMIAVRNKSDNITKLLLNHNADVNIPDNFKKTPLHDALYQARPQLVKLLLAFGADTEKPDVFGERPIYATVVKKPNLECLKILLNAGTSVEGSLAFGSTLLSRAILNFTDFIFIKTLVQYGASVNSTDLHTGKVPLHFSALINDTKLTEFLLSEGANPNVKTFYNFTPFDEAIFHKNLEVAEILYRVTTNANFKALKSLRSLTDIEDKA